MAPLGISEFTFGYAFLYEQTHANWGKLKAVPILPSLQQEKAAGWDAHLPVVGTDYYFQFKLSDYLHRPNAKYIADKTYNGPYYRLLLHRRDGNHQHRTLRQHSLVNRHTYYVAPEVDSLDVFNAAFLSHEITSKSRLIPIEDCDDIDDGEQHYITFRGGDPGWIQHSERKRHERSARGAELRELFAASRNDWRAIDREYAVGLFERTRGVVRDLLKDDKRWQGNAAVPLLQDTSQTAARGDILLRTADLLSVSLGATLVLVGERE